jgi:hypothetical protein
MKIGTKAGRNENPGFAGDKNALVEAATDAVLVMVKLAVNTE